MRYSKDHKQQTRDRIVRRASVKLREKGAHGIGVADLMKEAGLTHGGFYAHFRSRDELLSEAITYAMDRSIARWRSMSGDVPQNDLLRSVVENYLSQSHRDDPGHGCALPTLGPEISREGAKTRKAFAARLEGMIEMLTDMSAEPSRSAAQTQAITTLATMMGTLIMARIAGAGSLSDQILEAGREAALPTTGRKTRLRATPARVKASTTRRH